MILYTAEEYDMYTPRRSRHSRRLWELSLSLIATLLVVSAAPAQSFCGGTVKVTAGRDWLQITGDSANNCVRLYMGVAGFVAVTGLDGTSIQGPTVVKGLSKHTFTVNLKSGHDRLTLGNFTMYHGHWSIDGTGGDDIVTLCQSKIGVMDYNGGSGNDELRMDDSWFAIAGSTFQGGGGTDGFAMRDPTGYVALNVDSVERVRSGTGQFGACQDAGL